MPGKIDALTKDKLDVVRRDAMATGCSRTTRCSMIPMRINRNFLHIDIAIGKARRSFKA
jgi:hypothetical protein